MLICQVSIEFILINVQGGLDKTIDYSNILFTLYTHPTMWRTSGKPKDVRCIMEEVEQFEVCSLNK